MIRICTALIGLGIGLQAASAQSANSGADDEAFPKDVPPTISEFLFAVIKSENREIQVFVTRTIQEERSYTVSVNVDGRNVEEERIRLVDTPVVERHHPRVFDAYRLTPDGQTEELTAPPEKTTPALLAKDLNNITPYMKQLLRPGTIILIKKQDPAVQ